MQQEAEFAAATQLLDRGIAQLTFPVSAAMRAKLVDYLRLLEKWNRVHNLTAIREPAEQVRLHLLDCLVIVPEVKEAASIADIGSGAGLPGLILAICLPQCQFYLVESNHKKAAFLRAAAVQLKLDNVEVIAQRAENWHVSQFPDIVLSRAVSTIDAFIGFTAHLGDAHTQWMLMKAHDDEMCTTEGFAVTHVAPLVVPCLSAPRLLITVSRTL